MFTAELTCGINLAATRLGPKYKYAKKMAIEVEKPPILQTLLGTPAKKFWAAAIGINAAYISGFVASNYQLITNSIAAGDYAGTFLYSMVMASHCFYANLAITMPTLTWVGRMFMKPATKNFEAPAGELPKVTVQIPCRNEPFSVVTENAIKSALSLDYPEDKIEIQVLDNSDKGRYEKLQEYCISRGIKFIHRDGIEGAKARNLNIGTRTAKGEYLLVLDSDNRADSDFLMRVVKKIKTSPKMSYVFSGVDYWNTEENLFTKYIGNANNFINPSLYVMDNFGIAPFNGFGVLIDRNKMTEVGGWNDKMVAEDWDLCLRLKMAGYEGVRDPEAIVHDSVPSNLERFQIQQRRWAFGSFQLVRNMLKEVLLNKNISWERKISLLQYMSYYPGMSLGILAPAVLSIPLAMLSGVHEGGDLGTWWGFAWAYSTLRPFVQYAVSKAFNPQPEDLTSKIMKNMFQGLLVSFGMIPEASNGLGNSIAGKKEGFRITPKGPIQSSSTFLQTMSKHRTEMIAGSMILGASLFQLAPTDLYSFFGLGFVLSPVISWLAGKNFKDSFLGKKVF